MEIFRAYDIRGEYGKDITDEMAYKIARILSRTFKAKTMVIGRDVSLASPKIQAALISGSRDEGVDVYDIGQAGTDAVYFSVGNYGFDFGLEVTASHSAGYLSGIKILGPDGAPFGFGFGMEELKNNFLNYKDFPLKKEKGKIFQKDIWSDFVSKALSFVDVGKIKKMKVVVDASNSVGAIEIDKLSLSLPQVKFIRLNWTIDGNFPGHEPNPFLEENREQLSKKMRETKSDLGVAFDGDADRIYFLDEKGDYLFGVYLNGLIAEKMCKKEPGRVVLYDIRAYRYIKKKIIESGGIPALELVGHAYFKNRMRKENALFAGEASGHIYYNFGHYMVENSLIAFLQILEIISESGKSLGELTREPRINYPVSGEWNFSLPGFEATDDLTPEAMKKMNEILDKVRGKYKDGEISDFDTLTVTYPEWNFNLRPSANDPLLRYTGEATDEEKLKKEQKKLIEFLKSLGCGYVNDSGVNPVRKGGAF